MPLVIDATRTAEEAKKGATSPLETFYTYSGHALLEVKKMVFDVNVKKSATLEEAQDEARAKLVTALPSAQELGAILRRTSAQFGGAIR